MGDADARVTDFEVRTVGRFVCAGSTEGEVCNGRDDDCDGVVDDDAPCAGGLTCHQGRCRDCGDAEVCDGEDQDCDGTVDEGVRNASCEVAHNPRLQTAAAFQGSPGSILFNRFEVGVVGPQRFRFVSYTRFVPPENTAGRCIVRLVAIGGASPLLAMNVRVHLVEGPWDPRTLSWNNQPPAADEPIATVAVQRPNGSFEVELGDVCARWAEVPENNFGVKLTYGQAEGAPPNASVTMIADANRIEWILQAQLPGCE